MAIIVIKAWDKMYKSIVLVRAVFYNGRKEVNRDMGGCMRKVNFVKKMLPVILLAVALSFGACSKESAKKTSNNGNNEKEYVDIEKIANPLDISDELYERIEKDQFIDDEGNVKYLASLLYDGEMSDKKQCMNISIHMCDDDRLLLEYMYASEKDFAEGNDIDTHFEIYDRKTGELLKRLVFNANYAYIEKKSDCITVENFKEAITTVETYDLELNKIVKYTEGEDETSAVASPDGKRIYYVKKHRICMYDTENNERKTISSQEDYIVYNLEEIITDESGHDYVVFSGMAKDYNTYHFIYDTFENEVVRIYGQDVFYEIHDGFAIRNELYGDNLEYMSRIVGVSEDKAFYYDASDEMKEKNKEGASVELLVLNNGDLLFSTCDGKNVYVDVYDKDTGKLIAATAFDITAIRREPLKELQGEELEYYSDKMMILDNTFYLSENKMLITLTDFNGTKYFLQWEMEGTRNNNMLVVSDYEVTTETSVDISGFDNEILLPGEVSEELKPLKEYADRLEDEYDININIGDECSDVCETYLVYPLTDYKKVEEALETLEIALEKYPDNFFSQFKYEGADGVDIHISSQIMGITEDSLSAAGGFKCVENGRIKLVIDGFDENSLNITFHHELSHAIDEVINYKQSFLDEPVLDEEKWNELNPFEDMYSYNYVDWGKQEYWGYAYGMGNKEVYFVDTYAMTYPTEDRARLFEYIMREDEVYMDFDGSPHLQEKLNYFAECIRKTFDTTGWEDVPWEVYMD